jgi:signal peptidase II
MWTLTAVLLAVPIADLLVKALVGRALAGRIVSLGPLGSLRMVTARVWLTRFGWSVHPATLWLFWVVAAGILMTFTAWLPSAQVFAGLVLGGSLSNALESSWRGRVSDYVCLRFWPAFNLADLAITAGAVGLVVELVAAMRGASFTA